MIENVFMIHDINSIGGVESWLYYIAKEYKDKDIAIYYGTGDIKQIRRLREYVYVRQWKNGMKIKCKRAFYNFALMGIDDIDAEEHIFCIHADYMLQRIPFSNHPKLNRYIAVSKTAQKSFEERFGIKAEYFLNPLVTEEPKRVLKLMSATRLTAEKGKERMVILARKLKEQQIPYYWIVFTTDKNIPADLFMRHEPELDIQSYIADADYLVQLSSSEASCYSVREAISLGTPCITTDIQTFKEAGVINGKTGYILPLDMKDVDVRRIYEDIPKFEPSEPKDRYGSLLGRTKSKYKQVVNEKVRGKVLQPYYDMVLEKNVYIGDLIEGTRERIEYLEDRNLVRMEDDNDTL